MALPAEACEAGARPGWLGYVGDPGGATFMLLTPLPREDVPPPPDPSTPGLVSWHELYSSIGQEAAFAFHSGQFGWQTEDLMDMGEMGTYRIFSALRPGIHDPLMDELHEPDHGLWTFHQPLSVMGAEIGCRMTVVRLGRAAYPEARLHATRGVALMLPDVRFDVLLEHPGAVAAWNDTVDQLYFRSSDVLHELVLFHRATRTLIAADLAFNVQAAGGLLSGLLLRLNDSYRTFGPSRVCRSHIHAPHLARADLDAILATRPDRIVVSHGEILAHGAADALRRGYAWLK